MTLLEQKDFEKARLEEFYFLLTAEEKENLAGVFNYAAQMIVGYRPTILRRLSRYESILVDPMRLLCGIIFDFENGYLQGVPEIINDYLVANFDWKSTIRPEWFPPNLILEQYTTTDITYKTVYYATGISSFETVEVAEYKYSYADTDIELRASLTSSMYTAAYEHPMIFSLAGVIHGLALSTAFIYSEAGQYWLTRGDTFLERFAQPPLTFVSQGVVAPKPLTDYEIFKNIPLNPDIAGAPGINFPVYIENNPKRLSYLLQNGKRLAQKIRAVDEYGAELVNEINTFKADSAQRILQARIIADNNVADAQREAALIKRDSDQQIVEATRDYAFQTDNQLNQFQIMMLQLNSMDLE